MDYNIKIGGAAGQGIQTIGGSLSRVFSRSGYHLFAYQDYESRVRGGHNYFQIRFSDRRVLAPTEGIDILIALDEESITSHAGELNETGFAIYDSESLKQKHESPKFIDVPFNRLAVERGGDKIMANTVASGAVLGMLGLDAGLLVDVLRDTLAKIGPEALDANENAAKAGHEFASGNCPKCSFSVAKRGEPKMLVEGNEAIGLGAIAGGCRFYAAYPMTPSTGIMVYLAAQAMEHGIVVEQAEDEIAAINMALGASFAGVRAMTGTSGGGFALMVEGLSLAGMTETPVVIVLGQRPGPATGFPTRTEQADLLFALHTAHGEFPRIVFAPGTPEQAFYLVGKAFDLAEKYQVPALILTDQHYADSQRTINMLDLEQVKYTDYRVRGERFAGMPEYKRHAFTETGVSPLGVPGDAKHVVVTDSDEHDEEGHIVEDAETRIKMVDKRLLKKMPLISRDIEPPLLYGSLDPDVTIVCWGSNYGVVKETVDNLAGTQNVAMLHFSQIHPLPVDRKLGFMDILEKSKRTLCVENNATGKFARYLRAETGFKFDALIGRYDGRPFTVEGLTGELNGHT